MWAISIPSSATNQASDQSVLHKRTWKNRSIVLVLKLTRPRKFEGSESSKVKLSKRRKREFCGFPGHVRSRCPWQWWFLGVFLLFFQSRWLECRRTRVCFLFPKRRPLSARGWTQSDLWWSLARISAEHQIQQTFLHQINQQTPIDNIGKRACNKT